MSTRFGNISIDELAVHPKNVRREVGNVVDLANSIAAQGLLQPLVVAPNVATSSTPQPYTIIAGHRRHAAAKLANIDQLYCIVRDDLDTEPKQLEAMLVENTQRTDLTLMEEALGYQALLEFPGYNIKSIAKATGRSQSLVRSRVALTKLSGDAVDKIEDRTLNLDQALVLVDFTDDEAATKRLLRVADKPNDWAFQLAKEAKAKAWLENLPRLTAELQGAGVDIVERPEGQTWSWTGWRVSYTEMTVAEAVAGGWSAICDESEPEITWLKERPASATATIPQRTPEQLADDIRRQELTRGLATAAEVRTQFIKDAIQKPAADKTHEMLVDYILERHHIGDLAPWLDLDDDEDVEQQEVIDAVEKLNIPQLVALMHVDQFEREIHMDDVGGWKAGPDWQSTESWRGRLATVHGYQWTEAEQAVITYHQEQTNGADDE